jgi:phosphoserine aminotransferase
MNVYNFSAGPAMLPMAVMQQAQQEFLNWRNGGCSVMEVSHRSANFVTLAELMELDLRELMCIPDEYAVLFLPGGAQAQFSFIPMHLRGEYSEAAYIRTGLWSELAESEAQHFINVNRVADTSTDGYITLPDGSDCICGDKNAYLYYCDNETVHGVEFGSVPESTSVPLICDMSSNILSRPVDVNRFGLIFACSQKNLGAAGVTTVIIRRDLLERHRYYQIPKVFDYKKQCATDSMANTPVTFAWYLQSLVLQWVKQQGGVAEMDRRAQARCQLLYDCVDQSDLYENNVDPAARSRMNVPFHLAEPDLEAAFLEQAAVAGCVGLKGHRRVGGIRASIYNAMPLVGVEELVAFMKDFSL